MVKKWMFVALVLIWSEWTQQMLALVGVMDPLMMRQSLASAEDGAVVLLYRVVCVVAGRR